MGLFVSREVRPLVLLACERVKGAKRQIVYLVTSGACEVGVTFNLEFEV